MGGHSLIAGRGDKTVPAIVKIVVVASIMLALLPFSILVAILAAIVENIKPILAFGLLFGIPLALIYGGFWLASQSSVAAWIVSIAAILLIVFGAATPSESSGK